MSQQSGQVYGRTVLRNRKGFEYSKPHGVGCFSREAVPAVARGYRAYIGFFGRPELAAGAFAPPLDSADGSVAAAGDGWTTYQVVDPRSAVPSEAITPADTS